jgi:endonuclease YncB( thermonuclease family)
LFRPVINAPGVIQIASRSIRLADISTPGAEERCGPTNWPCGRMARAALRQLIRGRAILCEVPAGADRVPDAATCSIGNRDLAEWSVAQGWATAENERYAEAEKQARAARRGLWGDGVAKQPRPTWQARQETIVQATDFEAAGSAAAASSPDSARAINARVSGTP